MGPKSPFWGAHRIFIFHPILMGFFSLDSSQWELQKCFKVDFFYYRSRVKRYQRGQKRHFEVPIRCLFYSRFFLSLTVFELKGAKGTKNRHFEGLINFLFFIQFWWDFFHWIPLNERLKNVWSLFFLSLTLFELKGAKGAKNAILRCS